jgi:hypothetical protein
MKPFYGYTQTMSTRDRITVRNPSFVDQEQMVDEGIPADLARNAKLLETQPILEVSWENLTPAITTSPAYETIPMNVAVSFEGTSARNDRLVRKFADVASAYRAFCGVWTDSLDPLVVVAVYEHIELDDEIALRERFIALVEEEWPSNLGIGQLDVLEASEFRPDSGLTQYA